MAKKKRSSAKGPPPKAQKWLEEFKQGKHQGRKATPEHVHSIWDTDYIPERYQPATTKMIDETEARLGVVIPQSLKEQLLIQNGGYIVKCCDYPFENDSLYWTNATVDGIDELKGWKRAKDDDWFESVEDINNLHLLIRIASHSESQLCLDYRKIGPNETPGVTYIDTAMNPTEIRIVTDTVDDFIRGLVASRPAD